MRCARTSSWDEGGACASRNLSPLLGLLELLIHVVLIERAACVRVPLLVWCPPVASFFCSALFLERQEEN